MFSPTVCNILLARCLLFLPSVRQKSVLEGAHDCENFASFHRQWVVHQETGLLPRIKSDVSQPSRARTRSSQLFRGRDPVDEWTFGTAPFGKSTAAAGAANAKDMKRQNVQVITEAPAMQQLDRLGLPVVFPKPKSRPGTCGRPGTSARPGTEYRPNTKARIERRMEQQRLEDMPEPTPVDDSAEAQEKIDPNDIMRRLVKVASTGSQDSLDYEIIDVLGICAELCRRNKFLDAERLYRAVRQYAPENTTALCNLGVILERVYDNQRQAAQLYYQALEISGSNDTDCLLNLARVEYKLTGDISKPRQFLQRVLAHHPTHASALSNMALLLFSEWTKCNEVMQRKFENQQSIGKSDTLQIFDRRPKPKRMELDRSNSMHADFSGVLMAATDAMKVAEKFFWNAHDSAKLQNDQSSMALALGNIATVHKMVFQDFTKAEALYKKAIKHDPRHPILRRNFARLYHDAYDEKVEILTAVFFGKASSCKNTKGKRDRTAAQLGYVAETEYRAALDLMKINDTVKTGAESAGARNSKALKVDLYLNLASLLTEDAMGQRWKEARTLYKLAHECDRANLEAALGYGAIMWERENRLLEAEVVIQTALEADSSHRNAKGKFDKVRSHIYTMGSFVAVKADHIQVDSNGAEDEDGIKKKDLIVNANNLIDLAHFEGLTWELKASSVYQDSDKFGVGSVFDPDNTKEWATISEERNVGEWVYVKYSEPYYVGMVKIKQRSNFAQMVRKIGIYFDGGENTEMLLFPEPDEQELVLEHPILTRLVRVEILQVYGNAITGLNTIQVFGQHRSAHAMTKMYHDACSSLLKLKALTANIQADYAQKQKNDLTKKAVTKEPKDEILVQLTLMYAKIMLASDKTQKRELGAKMVLDYFSNKVFEEKRAPRLFSSALSAYGAYLQANESAVVKPYEWLPFSSVDTPREQGEKLFIMALDVSNANVDAQLRLATSYTERLADCQVEEREFWSAKVENYYHTALVTDPQNINALYHYALFLQQHMRDLNQAVELLRRAAKCFCANTELKAAILCSLATGLHRRGCLEGGTNIFSVREEEESIADKTGWKTKQDNEDISGLSNMKDLNEAALWYERCLAINPRSISCLCNYAILQLHRNYPNKALKYFAHAVHIEPFNSKLLSAYAAVLDDLGMPLNVVERMYIRALQQVRTLTLFVSRWIY